MKKKKILIIGGAGLIGSKLSEILIKKKYQVIIFDAFLNYLDPNKNKKIFVKRLKKIKSKIKLIKGDTRNKKKLENTILKIKPDFIVHLANLPLADYSNKNPSEAISSILVGTTNILEIIKNLVKIPRFIFASSSMIYGDFKYFPCDENHEKNPKDIYGGAKYAAETLIQTYSRGFNVTYTIIRPSAVYGPYDVNRRVSQIFIENAIKGKKIILHNSGNSKLDFTYVDDIAQGFYLAIKKSKISKNKIYNITRGKGRSLKDFAFLLKKKFKNLKIINQKAKVFRPERGSLSILKAKKELGYNPKTDIEKGIIKNLEYYKKTK